jgi:N-glycosylase/DNA lyase
MKGMGSYRGVTELQHEYASRREAIRRRLDEFKAVPPAAYFYELVYCLLTPQSSAINATKAVEQLRALDFFTSAVHPASVLSAKTHYIRFHNTKAKRLLEAREQFPAIKTLLAEETSAPELRAWLVRNVQGLGWKEASHFLRNIGHRDLAILDRHILRNLRRHGVIRTLPGALSAKRYRAIEDRFSLFARRVGIPMDELDLLFWSRETGEILK